MKKAKIGHLEIYTGCMFSGKTDALIATLWHLKQTNKTLLVFKPQIDSRSGKCQIKSQTGKTWPALGVQTPIEIAQKINENLSVDAVAIDETQFFELDLLPFVEKWLNQGIDVYIGGLDRGFSDHDLPIMNKLFAYADRVTKLFAYCNKCGGVANKTQRIDSHGSPVSPAEIKTNQDFVGGVKLYEARCRKCYVYFPWN